MSRFKRILWRVLLFFATAAFVLGLLAGIGWWYLHPKVARIDRAIYTQRHGRDLTLDVIRPVQPSGAGVLMMVSGSWKSNPSKDLGWIAAPFLRSGQTVVAVSHLSQPEASVMEIVEDVNRAVRFVRHHAGEYGIDPARIGVTGASSGGHLSLMLATCGCPGRADAADPVDREDSSVQAAAVFFPVTDLLNLGASTENAGDGGPPRSFVKAFGPDATDLVKWRRIGRDVSPIYHIQSGLPPVFIEHGDADTLVPLDQSERFQRKAGEMGCDVKLVVQRGCRHGWLTMPWDMRTFALWFDAKLARPAR